MPGNPCAFTSCSCLVAQGSKYCSAPCRERDRHPDNLGSKRACGHLDCVGDRKLQKQVEKRAAQIASVEVADPAPGATS